MPEGSAARKFSPAVDWSAHWPRIATWPGLRPEPTAAWRTLCEAWPANSDRMPLSAAYRLLMDGGVSVSSACRRIQALLREGLAVKEVAPSSDPSAGMVAWLLLVDPATIEEKRPRWHRKPPRVRSGDRQSHLFEDEPVLLSLYKEPEMAELPETEEAETPFPFPLCAQEAETEKAEMAETTPAIAPPPAGEVAEARRLVRDALSALGVAPLRQENDRDVPPQESKKAERIPSTPSKIKESNGSCARSIGEVLPEAIEDQLRRLEERTTPAARAQAIRQRITNTVPGVEPDWWVAWDLAEAVVFGAAGKYLDEGAIDAVLASFTVQMDRARRGLRRDRFGRVRKIDDPPALFALIVRETLPKPPWNWDWCPDGRRRKRE